MRYKDGTNKAATRCMVTHTQGSEEAIKRPTLLFVAADKIITPKINSKKQKHVNKAATRFCSCRIMGTSANISDNFFFTNWTRN